VGLTCGKNTVNKHFVPGTDLECGGGEHVSQCPQLPPALQVVQPGSCSAMPSPSLLSSWSVLLTDQEGLG
jgi:hypothetical protein